jgi:hypothetical protein
VRQGSGSIQLELDRVRRQLQDHMQALDEARRRAGQLDTYRAEMDAIRSAQQAAKVEVTRREQEMAGELQLLKQSKQLLQQEVEALKQSLELQKRGAENAVSDCNRLKLEVSELRIEKERQRKEFSLMENSRADAQLQGLRRELEQTMSEWQIAEKEKTAKDEGMWRVQKELEREREKSSLLKTQIGLLDERLRVSSQELGVYRSLDVYHSSLNSELLLLRSSNKSRSPSPSSRTNGDRSQNPLYSGANGYVKSPERNRSTVSLSDRSDSGVKLTLSQMGTTASSGRDFDRPSTLAYDDLSSDGEFKDELNGKVGRTYDSKLLNGSAISSINGLSSRMSLFRSDPVDRSAGLSQYNAPSVKGDAPTFGAPNSSPDKSAHEARRNSLLAMRSSAEVQPQVVGTRRPSVAAARSSVYLETKDSLPVGSSTAASVSGANRALFSSLDDSYSSDNARSQRQDRDLLRQQKIREQLSSAGSVGNARTGGVAMTPTSSMQATGVGRNAPNSVGQRMSISSLASTTPASAISASKPMSTSGSSAGGNDKAGAYKPLKADFDKARRLLAKSGLN